MEAIGTVLGNLTEGRDQTPKRMHLLMIPQSQKFVDMPAGTPGSKTTPASPGCWAGNDGEKRYAAMIGINSGPIQGLQKKQVEEVIALSCGIDIEKYEGNFIRQSELVVNVYTALGISTIYVSMIQIRVGII